QMGPGSGGRGGGRVGSDRSRVSRVGGHAGEGPGVVGRVVLEEEPRGLVAVLGDRVGPAAGGRQIRPRGDREGAGGVEYRAVGGDLLSGGRGEGRAAAGPGRAGGVRGVARAGGVGDCRAGGLHQRPPASGVASAVLVGGLRGLITHRIVCRGGRLRRAARIRMSSGGNLVVRRVRVRRRTVHAGRVEYLGGGAVGGVHGAGLDGGAVVRGFTYLVSGGVVGV